MVRDAVSGMLVRLVVVPADKIAWAVGRIVAGAAGYFPYRPGGAAGPDTNEAWLNRTLDITTGSYPATLLVAPVGGDPGSTVIAAIDWLEPPATAVAPMRRLRGELSAALSRPAGVEPARPRDPMSLNLGPVELTGGRWQVESSEAVTVGRVYSVRYTETGQLVTVAVVGTKAARLLGFTTLTADLKAAGATRFSPAGRPGA